MIEAFKNWFKNWNRSADEVYLSDSTDYVDFERRLRVIERPYHLREQWWVYLNR